MKQALLLFLLIVCGFGAGLQAQTTVTGTVVDGGGESLIGANVVEKGTTNGTATDLNGFKE